ncbi:hypothetical protein RB195_003083 [Necator americanus]|uniref:alkaline phosphatase n=1 Tax=Necator americanus TaxID=51031 RepID=A0ABR1DNF2_NECAM
MLVQALFILYLQLLRVSEQIQRGLALDDVRFWNLLGKENISRKLKWNPHLLKAKRPKNVILFIGDGMGLSIVTPARINKNQKARNPYLNKPLFFETFRAAGLVKTSSFTHHVTDSAAGAVALVGGVKTRQVVVVGIDTIAKMGFQQLSSVLGDRQEPTFSASEDKRKRKMRTLRLLPDEEDSSVSFNLQFHKRNRGVPITTDMAGLKDEERRTKFRQCVPPSARSTGQKEAQRCGFVHKVNPGRCKGSAPNSDAAEEPGKASEKDIVLPAAKRPRKRMDFKSEGV